MALVQDNITKNSFVMVIPRNPIDGRYLTSIESKVTIVQDFVSHFWNVITGEEVLPVSVSALENKNYKDFEDALKQRIAETNSDSKIQYVGIKANTVFRFEHLPDDLLEQLPVIVSKVAKENLKPTDEVFIDGNKVTFVYLVKDLAEATVTKICLLQKIRRELRNCKTILKN